MEVGSALTLVLMPFFSPTSSFQANRAEAERARDMGAEAMRQGNHARASRLFRRSLNIFPLPGVEAMLAQVEPIQNQPSTNGGAFGREGVGVGGTHGHNHTAHQEQPIGWRMFIPWLPLCAIMLCTTIFSPGTNSEQYHTRYFSLTVSE